MNNVTAKNSVRPRKNTAEGGGGGNSAVFLRKIEAKPAALLGESRTQPKKFLFLFEETIPRPPLTKKKKKKKSVFCWGGGGGLGGGWGGWLP